MIINYRYAINLALCFLSATSSFLFSMDRAPLNQNNQERAQALYGQLIHGGLRVLTPEHKNIVNLLGDITFGDEGAEVEQITQEQIEALVDTLPVAKKRAAQDLYITLGGNLIQECSICMDDKEFNEFSILTCDHMFCKTCLNNQLDIGIAARSTDGLCCFNIDCRHNFEQEDLERITDNRDKIQSINDIKVQEWINQQPNAKQCPTADCTFRFLFDGDENNQYLMQCHGCNQQYCTNCLLNHTQEVSCTQAQENRQEDQEDQENQQWLEENTKPCPNCNSSIEKDGGCKHMQCTHCHHHFCWDCLEDWDYNTHPSFFNCGFQNR